MANKTSDAQIKASNKYNAKATKTVLVRLNIEKDADILEQLSKQKSMMGYIKELIRKDMKTNTGHWINSAGDDKCSVCGAEYGDLYPDYSKTHYCPNCGSKMI